MAGSREIRTKIESVKSTKKITKAMQMVASSKMRKTQNRMAATRPYAEKLLDVIAHLAMANPEYKNAYMKIRPTVRKVGYIVITTDRGLCGALNTNVLRATLKDMQRWETKGVETDLSLVGNKADAFFRHFGGNVVAKGNHIDDKTHIEDIIGMVKIMMESYRDAKIDMLFVCYNKFISTMKQQATIQQLLPITPHEVNEKARWDYIYEPDPKSLLDHLMKRYLEMEVYQSAVENLASEQSARMISMMNATNNADELIKELQLVYNKARQAAITQEISEIVGGAAAIK